MQFALLLLLLPPPKNMDCWGMLCAAWAAACFSVLLLLCSLGLTSVGLQNIRKKASMYKDKEVMLPAS